MTKTVGHQARKHTALLMAVYTFLLALGAALPLAASYQPGLEAEEAEGEIHCGGYARSVQADEAEDEEAGERPPARRPAVRATASVDSDVPPAATTCGETPAPNPRPTQPGPPPTTT